MVTNCVKGLILLKTLKRFDIGELSTRKLANRRIHEAKCNMQFCYTQKIFIGDYSSAITATFAPIGKDFIGINYDEFAACKTFFVL